MQMEDAPLRHQIKFNGWRGFLYLETVHRLNHRAIALLMEAAQSDDLTEELVAAREILALFEDATEEVLIRVMRFPMVLLDFNFQMIDWWREVTYKRLPDGLARQSVGARRIDQAVTVARDLLMEVWSASRSLPATASLVFGMAPEVTTLIAQLSPTDIDRVVLREINSLKLRWNSRPVFWKGLFHAAAQVDDESLENVHLHCLQLLGGDLAIHRPLTSSGVHIRPVNFRCNKSLVVKRPRSIARPSFAENGAKLTPPVDSRRAVITTNQIGRHEDVIDRKDTTGTV